MMKLSHESKLRLGVGIGAFVLIVGLVFGVSRLLAHSDMVRTTGFQNTIHLCFSRKYFVDSDMCQGVLTIFIIYDPFSPIMAIASDFIGNSPIFGDFPPYDGLISPIDHFLFQHSSKYRQDKWVFCK